MVLTSFHKQGSLDTYLREVRTIRESRMLYPAKESRDDEQAGEEEDPDAVFLQQAGFGSFVTKLESGEGMEDSSELDSQTAALPKAHAALVMRRMNTLRSTLRSKHQNGESGGQRGDVRAVFSRARENKEGQTNASHSPALERRLHGSSPRGQSPAASPRGSPTPHHSPNLHTRTHHSPAPQHSPPSSSSSSSASSNLPQRHGNGRQASSHTHPRTPYRQSSDSELRRARVRNGDRGREGARGFLTPQGSLDSPDQEDIKLHFGSPAHSYSSQSANYDQLPNFTIMPDVLGITYIEDLSAQDRDKVRSLALLELTVTFDDHNIPLRPRRPAKVKGVQEDRLFGSPLSTLLQNDRKREPNAMIPLLLLEMITTLEERALGEEGILRIPGSAARLNLMQQELEATFNSGGFSFEGKKATDVASLLKQFLRDLPVPLLTREHLPAFASIADIEDLKEQVRTLNLLILLLPDLHQRVLKRLLLFLERVVQHSEANKMDLMNVSMVIAPNFFVALPSRQSLDDVLMAAKTSHVVRLLIKYRKLLWTVPGEMLKQVRFLYESEVRRLTQRSVQRALKQMQHLQLEQQASEGRRAHENEHHIIRIKAPLFTRVCMAVNIQDGVTAGDIITKLQKRSRLNRDVVRKRFSNSSLLDSTSSTSSDEGGESPLPIDAGEQFLFEVGGNIGERCLSHDTDMQLLYSINPNAQWVIKPKDCPDLN